LNVLFISHMYPNKYNLYSGIFVHKQVLALKKYYGQAINIKVVSPIPYAPLFLEPFSEKYRTYRNMPYSEIIEGIEVFYPTVFLLPKNLNFASSGSAFYYGIKNLVKRLENSDFKIDLIHSHVALPDGVCAKMLKNKFNRPYIITIHGQDMDYTINKSNNLKNKVFNAINNSERTIFVSEKLRSIACNYVKDQEKLMVVHNGINIEELSEDTEELNKQFEGKRVLLSVSNLINTKGHDLTIKAFAYLRKEYKNLQLVIIGTGVEEHNLKKLSKNLGVSDDVIFTGQLSNSEVMKYLKKCEIFVLPSWREGFGVAYIEAMANNKCVVACKGEGISDVILDGINGILIEPRDLDSLIQNLEMLIKNEDLTKQIGKKAAQDIREKFTWKHNAEIMMGVYTEVIEKCH
jgi:teichuronic acid biosynthesis glycosyltransferase TuaC